MKKVINGKLYDTDQADLVSSTVFFDEDDKQDVKTCLYKTKKGNFFVCYQGQDYNDRDYIKDLTKDEAIEQYESLGLDSMSYEEAFGVKPELG